jgi:hypothetical protein
VYHLKHVVSEKEIKGGVDVLKLCCDWQYHKEPVVIEECLSGTNVCEWHERFKEGRELLQDDEWKDCNSTSRKKLMEVIEKCLAKDRTLRIRKIAVEGLKTKKSVLVPFPIY